MDNNELNEVKQEILQTSTPLAGFTGEVTVTVIDLCSSDDSDIEEDVGRLEDSGSAYPKYNSGNPIGAKRARDSAFGGSSEVDMNHAKKLNVDELAVVSPEESGQSTPPADATHAIPADPCNVFRPMPPQPPPSSGVPSGRSGSCKQFWKAGDYEGVSSDGNWDITSGKPKTEMLKLPTKNSYC